LIFITGHFSAVELGATECTFLGGERISAVPFASIHINAVAFLDNVIYGKCAALEKERFARGRNEINGTTIHLPTVHCLDMPRCVS
jgi:hypothetical protein